MAASKRQTSRNDGTVPMSLRFKPEIWSVLRAHAYVRNVSMNKFMEDFTRAYLCYITDFNHPYFKPEATGVAPLTPPESDIPGYIESLGFVAPQEGDKNVAPPPSAYPDHGNSTPHTQEDLAFLDFDKKKTA
jgi:hypothetical protein